MKTHPLRTLGDVVSSRGGNNNYIKGKQSAVPAPGLVQGFSASGPDVWVKGADYSGPGVVLSAVGARCGKTFLADGEWTAIANTHALIPSAEIDAKYLWYLTNREDFWVKGGSAQPFVKVKETLSRKVPLPPLDEQKRIVATMDALAGRHAALLQVNAALGSEAQALRTCLVDSMIQEVEAHAPLVELCEVFVDGDWIESKDQSPEGIRLVQTGNVGAGFFKANDERARFISEETFAKLRCTEVLPGDCLVSRLPEPVGRACVVPDVGSRMITAVDCTLIRPSSRLLAAYFIFVTQSSQYAAQIRERSTGSTRTRVSRKNLGQVLIPLPSMDEQEAIVRRLLDVDDKVSALLHVSTSRRELADRFASGLLSDLMGSAG